MRRYGGAAILMQSNFNELLQDVNFLFPPENNIETLVRHKSFVPFEESVCEFLNEVSKLVMKDPEAKLFPDVVTFGFFCRKANVELLRKTYGKSLDCRLGRGVAFHVAPSNVPINFAYTLLAGLLSGNKCIVRVSSKDFAQTRLLCRIFNEVVRQEKFECIKNIVSVVMYEHNDKVTDVFSSLADIRIIWGGDNTISKIRRTPLKPRAFDITFADRYSFAVFDSAFILVQNESAMKNIAQDFYNDTYLYDQNACSSPRLIVWHGSEEACDAAKKKFWAAVHENIVGKYELAPILAVDKLSAKYKSAIELDGAKIEASEDNLITRIKLSELPHNITDYVCAGGCYLEYNTMNFSDIASLVNQKFQTLSYIGMDAMELQKFVMDNGLTGIDRIVPVGKTADFGLVWDGYDLITTMSRVVFAN